MILRRGSTFINKGCGLKTGASRSHKNYAALAESLGNRQLNYDGVGKIAAIPIPP
jgi:hypothetical protein